jgi:glycosyltransferase involved in cell wall biosynthesis
VKLVFINDNIYRYASGAASAVGGAERQQWLLARVLAANGWSVSVGICRGLHVGQREMIDNVQFTGVGRGRGHVMQAWSQFLASERPAWWYWRCASHLLGPAVAIARSLKVKTAFAAGLDPDVTPRLALYSRRRWWPLYAWGLAWADRIFVQHDGQLSALATKWRGKSFIVPSIAGELGDYVPHDQRDDYVAWVGQLKYPKRPDRLLQMAQLLPDVRFVVCGGPSDFGSRPGYGESMIDSLRSLTNVDYRGQVAPEVASQVIANAALLFSTSEEEGFPNTFLQSWSRGTPVISLRVDPDQAITCAQLGAVCDTPEIAGVAIRRLLRSSQERDAIAARSLHHVQERHSDTAVLKAAERAFSGGQQQ